MEDNMKNFLIALGMLVSFILGYYWHFHQTEQAANLLYVEKKFLECQKEALMDKIGWLEADRSLLFNELTPKQRVMMRRKLERR